MQDDDELGGGIIIITTTMQSRGAQWAKKQILFKKQNKLFFNSALFLPTIINADIFQTFQFEFLNDELGGGFFAQKISQMAHMFLDSFLS